MSTLGEFLAAPFSTIIRDTIAHLRVVETMPNSFVYDSRYYVRRMRVLDKDVIAVDFGGAVLTQRFGVSPEAWDELVDAGDDDAPELKLAHALMDLQLGCVGNALRELGKLPGDQATRDAIDELGDRISDAFDYSWYARRAPFEVYLGVADELEKMGL